MVDCKLYRRYPLSSAFIVIIWTLCLIPVFPETPLDGVPLMDKWTHFVMYGTFTATIWFEYLRQHQTKNASKLFLFAFLAPIAMGGIVELTQAYCTGGRRSGEWLDFAANSIGVVLGSVIGILLAPCFARGRKET